MDDNQGFDFSPVNGFNVSYRPGVRHVCTKDPCPFNSRLSALEKKISDAQRVLLDLMEEYTVLKVEANQFYDRMRHLPVEVISHIFKHCKPTPPIPNEDQRRWELSDPIPHVRFPLMIGKICHRWREIAWSTPQLWTTVYACPGNSMFLEPRRISVLSAWMNRSGQLPLRIMLRSPRRIESSGTKPNPVLDVIRQHSRRWRSIVFYGDQSTVERLLENDYEHPMQPLDYLAIDILSNHSSRAKPSYSLPKAERIHLRDFVLKDNGIRPDWKDTTFLGISVKDTRQLCPLVPFMQNIQTLELECTFHVESIPTLYLPLLKRLILSGNLDVLEYINMSSTPTLEIRQDVYATTVIPEPELFPSLQHLTTLRISGCSVDEDMLRLLQSLINLTSLGIFCKMPKEIKKVMEGKRWTQVYAVVNNDFWPYLTSRTYTPPRESPQPFLPMLTDFEYDGTHPPEWSTILRLCHAKAQRNSSLTGASSSGLNVLKMKIHREYGDPIENPEWIDEEMANSFRELIWSRSLSMSASIAFIDQGVCVDLIENNR